MKSRAATLVAVSLETTDLNPLQDRITEVARFASILWPSVGHLLGACEPGRTQPRAHSEGYTSPGRAGCGYLCNA